jgi:hypothetical protein
LWNASGAGGRQNVKTNWDKAIEFVLQEEGGYVNDPADPGGETNYGISKRAYPDVDIRSLTRNAAIEIYKKDYWEKAGCDSLPSPIDICVFDTAVNMGVAVAKEIASTNLDYRDFLLERIDRYIKITLKRPNSIKFFRGWIIRLNRLRKLCRG